MSRAIEAMEAAITGEGSPLVLVGGGFTGRLGWAPLVPRLAATRRVIALQPLNVAWGLAEHPLPADYAIATEARGLAAALDAADLHGPVDVAAWSAGGLAALAFALDHPARIRTLALIEPPALWLVRALDPEAAEVRAFVASMSALAGEISEAALAQFALAAGLVPPGADPRAHAQWPVWFEHRRSLRASASILAHRDDPGRLANLAAPVLLVGGRGSAPIYQRSITELARRLPAARAIELPAGHAPHLVSAEAFLAELAALHR